MGVIISGLRSFTSSDERRMWNSMDLTSIIIKSISWNTSITHFRCLEISRIQTLPLRAKSKKYSNFKFRAAETEECGHAEPSKHDPHLNLEVYDATHAADGQNKRMPRLLSTSSTDRLSAQDCGTNDFVSHRYDGQSMGMEVRPVSGLVHGLRRRGLVASIG